MSKTFIIEQCIEVSDETLDSDKITDMFIDWVESNGWTTGGIIKEYTKEDEEKDIDEIKSMSSILKKYKEVTHGL